MKMLAKKSKLRGSSADGLKLGNLRNSLMLKSGEARAAELQKKHSITPVTPPGASPSLSSVAGSSPIALRKLWNRAMPVLNCSSCAFSSSCPSFRSGYECAFLPFFTAHSVETTDDLMFYAKELLQQNLRRAQQAMTMETISGAAPSLELSESLHGLFQQILALHERLSKGPQDISSVKEDSIVSGLFGNLNNLVESTRSADRTIALDSADALSVRQTSSKTFTSKKVSEDLLADIPISTDSNHDQPR